jgi:fibronectin type 3 domain-containing protein
MILSVMAALVFGEALITYALGQGAKPSSPTIAEKAASKVVAALAAPSALLTWNQPNVGCSGTQSCTYNIYRGPTSGSETKIVSGVVGQTYTDTNVTRGLSYCWEVTASNGVGESALSNEVCATIPVVPSAPSGLTVVVQ